VPSWDQVLAEIQGERPVHPIDSVRRKYLRELNHYTGRNVIAYYSGWLSEARPAPALNINDEDKNAFMSVIKGLDRDRGLDLILHTPGGDVAAAESLVDYLRKMFGTDIRAIVPQLAMSAGTMIACACSSILMGKQSNLGPIDPQFNGIPANGVIAEFNKAVQQIQSNPASAPLWQSIIGKYHPTFLGACENAVKWAEAIVVDWLSSGMFAEDERADNKARYVVQQLTDPSETFNHSRHIHVETLQQMGLRIECLEDDAMLQDLVLTVHHAYMHAFSMTRALKIVENHDSVAVVRQAAAPPNQVQARLEASPT